MENLQPLLPARQHLFGPGRQFLRLCRLSPGLIQRLLVPGDNHDGLPIGNHIFCRQFQNYDVDRKMVEMESYPL